MSNHLKRLNMPRTWKINRKGFKFMINPDAGKDPESSMPLLPLLRDMLKVVSTAKEARYVINEGKILINQIKAKRPQQNVGMFDVLSFAGANYRLLINEKNQFYLEPIKDAEAKITFSKVLNKTLLKKGKVQLNLLNGYNIIVEKDTFKVGDTVELSLPKMTIKTNKSLKKGDKVLIFKGAHSGISGVVEQIKEGGISIKAEKKVISTLEDYTIAL